MSRGRWGQYLRSGRQGWWYHFQKMGLEGVLQLAKYHTAQPSRKVLSRGLERRLRPIVEPQIQDGQLRFLLGCGTVDQLFTPRSLAIQSTCGRYCGRMGYQSRCPELSGPCQTEVRVVSVFSTQSTRTLMPKRELSRNAKLSIYQSIYVQTRTYGHELCSVVWLGLALK